MKLKTGKLKTGNLKTGNLKTGILLVTLCAGSALAQISNAVPHVKDKINGAQQQIQAASDAALKGSATASGTTKAPAGKASAGKPSIAPVAKLASVVAQKSSASVAPAKQAVAKSAAAPAKATAIPAAAKPAVTATVAATKKQDPFAKAAAPKVAAAKAPAIAAKKAEAKPAEIKKADAKPADTKADAKADSKEEAKDDSADKKKEGFITAGSRRDPFVSPIVQHMAGTGCSTGKRCLAIDQIALRGIVKSDAGMIAVVVNSLDKAYFLRENDPVFNGYVLKISGDTVVFKETVQDKLGHLSTREVVKKITTPAV